MKDDDSLQDRCKSEGRLRELNKVYARVACSSGVNCRNGRSFLWKVCRVGCCCSCVEKKVKSQVWHALDVTRQMHGIPLKPGTMRFPQVLGARRLSRTCAVVLLADETTADSQVGAELCTHSQIWREGWRIVNVRLRDVPDLVTGSMCGAEFKELHLGGSQASFVVDGRHQCGETRNSSGQSLR